MNRSFPCTEFAFLLITAITYYYAGKLILVIAFIAAFVWAWVKLSMRYPKTMLFATSFLMGLLGRRRW